MTNGELLEKIKNGLNVSAKTQDGEIHKLLGQDRERSHFFLAKIGDQVFEVQCLEVDPGAWL